MAQPFLEEPVLEGLEVCLLVAMTHEVLGGGGELLKQLGRLLCRDHRR